MGENDLRPVQIMPRCQPERRLLPTIYWMVVVSPNKQRYTWRHDHHDSILKYICENVDSEKYQHKADINGFSLLSVQISSSMTDNRFWNSEILNAHTRKTEKYSHFVTDITSVNVKLIPFEIGSRGYTCLRKTKLAWNCCLSTEPTSSNDLITP